MLLEAYQLSTLFGAERHCETVYFAADLSGMEVNGNAGRKLAYDLIAGEGLIMEVAHAALCADKVKMQYTVFKGNDSRTVAGTSVCAAVLFECVCGGGADLLFAGEYLDNVGIAVVPAVV